MSGRFGFHEFELRMGMAEFTELGLEQRVIAGVVHQGDVIFKFGGETDGQNFFCKRNRVGFEEITPDERAGAAGGFNKPGPERFEVAGRWRLCRCCGFLKRSYGCGRCWRNWSGLASAFWKNALRSRKSE